MIKILFVLKKTVLFGAVLALGLAALPFHGASAAALQAPAVPPASRQDYPRLERVWALQQRRYEREGNLLAKADTFIQKAQALLDRATRKGWDVSAIQAALNAFEAAVPAAQAAHAPGEAIIRTHSGFTANGDVTDRDKAVETVKALQQVLKDTRLAMNGTGRALWQAIHEFRQAHRSSVTPAP
jgi:hypothetical protein